MKYLSDYLRSYVHNKNASKQEQEKFHQLLQTDEQVEKDLKITEEKQKRLEDTKQENITAKEKAMIQLLQSAHSFEILQQVKKERNETRRKGEKKFSISILYMKFCTLLFSVLLYIVLIFCLYSFSVCFYFSCCFSLLIV